MYIYIQQSSPDMPPVDADGGGTGGAAVGDGMSGGGEGVTLTPTGYDEPLELPDGCHHISLTKFLEVNGMKNDCCISNDVL